MSNSESNAPMTSGAMHDNESATSGELLSSFMDGEMDKQAAAFFVRRLAQDETLQEEWTRWHLVRSYLRDGDAAAGGARPDLASRVRAALAAEEAPAVVTAGGNRWTQRMLKPVASAAIAATVAMTAIIGVNQFYAGDARPGGNQSPGTVVAVAQPDVARAQHPAARDAGQSGRSIPSLVNSPSVPLEAVPVSLQQGSHTTVQDPLARARLEAYLLRHYTHARVNGSASLVGYMSNFNRDEQQQELNTAQREQARNEETPAQTAPVQQE